MNLFSNIKNNSQALIRCHRLRCYIYFLLVVILFLVIDKVYIEWKWAHIFFSYEYGFLKRGLIGELLRLTKIPTSLDNFKILSVLMLVGITTAFFNIIKKEPTIVFIGFSLIFFCSPLLLKNLVYDWGRFDQIAIMVVLLQLLWIGDARKSNYLLFCSPLLIFIHEATLLWAFPTILAIAFFENRKTLYLLIPLIALSTGVILIWGGLDIAPNTYLTLLEEWAKPNNVHWAIIYTLTASLKDSILYSVPALIINMHSERGYIAETVCVVSSIPLFFYKQRIWIILNFFALMSASTLFIIANDHFRWISLLGIINLFFLLYAYKKNQIKNVNLMSVYLISIGMIVSFMSPVGIF